MFTVHLMTYWSSDSRCIKQQMKYHGHDDGETSCWNSYRKDRLLWTHCDLNRSKAWQVHLNYLGFMYFFKLAKQFFKTGTKRGPQWWLCSFVFNTLLHRECGSQSVYERLVCFWRQKEPSRLAKIQKKMNQQLSVSSSMLYGSSPSTAFGRITSSSSGNPGTNDDEEKRLHAYFTKLYNSDKRHRIEMQWYGHPIRYVLMM